MGNRMWKRIFLLCFLTLGLSSIGCTQESEQQDLRKEIEALKRGQEQIREELKDIKELLQGREKAQPSGPNVRDVEFDLGKNPVLGKDTARLTLVEFTDYQ
jgi:protein-disulfide isomerase